MCLPQPKASIILLATFRVGIKYLEEENLVRSIVFGVDPKGLVPHNLRAAIHSAILATFRV